MPRILYLTHRVPYPPNRGDRIRSYHMLRFLAERAEVYLGCLADEPVDQPALAKLARWCADVRVASLRRGRWLRAAWSLATGRSATEGLFRSSSLRRSVRRWAGTVDFDAVLVFCSSMVQFTEIPELAQVPIVVDLVNVDSQKFLDYASGTSGLKRWLYRIEGRRVRQLERKIAQRARAVMLASEREAELFRSAVPCDHVYGVTNGVDLEYFHPTIPPTHFSPSCVFTGVLDYRPNVEGLRWFCREVWPAVRQRVPDATFSIVGRQAGEVVRRLGELPGVTMVGEVPDVRPHVWGATVVIAPLQIARGIQNKVLEAMALGRPVLATPQALEGLQVKRGVDVLQADTADEWVEQLAHLFWDARARQKLAVVARCHVEANHSWPACLQPLEKVLGVR